MTSLLFSHCKNIYGAAYLYGLNPSYKAPSHGAMVGYLLDQCYEDFKRKSLVYSESHFYQNSNINRLIYLYINKRILSRKVDLKKKS